MTGTLHLTLLVKYWRRFRDVVLDSYAVLGELTERRVPPVFSKSSTSLCCLSVALIDVSRYSASTTTQTNLYYLNIYSKLATPLLDDTQSSISFHSLTQSTISARSSYAQRKTGMNYLRAAHSSVPPVSSPKLFNIPNLLQTWKRITDLREKSFSSHS